MTDLTNKRLLVLSGGTWANEIKKVAEKYNLVIISSSQGYSPLQEIADELYDFDPLNAENMKGIIIDKKIDGVYLGGNEAVIQEASKYLRELELNSYCTPEQFDILHNKKKFKKLCQEMDLPVVPAYSLSDFSIENHSLYPVITKPVSGSGSEGFSVCNDLSQLNISYNKAKKHSRNGEVIIEKFVDNTSVVVFYDINSEDISFVGIEDKYNVHFKDSNSYVLGMLIFQSELKNIFLDKYDQKIKNMAKHLDLKEGTFWIEIFTNGNDFYFNEIGYRYGGSISFYPISYFTGINQVEKDIYYALSGISKTTDFIDMISSEIDRNQNYCIYSFVLDAGKISKIEGLKEVESLNNVINIIWTKSVGNTVNKSGNINQISGYAHFTFKDYSELNNTVNFIHKNLIINNEYNANMLKKMITLNKESMRNWNA